MSSAQPGSQPGRSPGLTLNLSSNNPFRNRAASPGALNPPSSLSPAPTSPFDDPPPPPRPVSRNPFLDPNYSSSQPSLIDTGAMSSSAPKFDSKSSPTAEELFDNLTIEDKAPPQPEGAPPRPPTKGPPGPPGPPGSRGPPRGHRLTKSQEEALRAKRMQAGGPRRPGPGGPSVSPQRRPERRPRRNSESSILDIEKPKTEDEKKLREMRRREKERRARAGEGGGSSKDKKPSRRLDVIDQLDATSLFGGGFHHDGPFDAVTSHRNRRGRRHAPMQAFPKDSLNMSIGGSGPLNKQSDQATLMGTANDEAFKEYSNGVNSQQNAYNPGKSREAPVFDPRARTAVLHGEESLGLGTSTFLEGTPAARTAIQRRQAEQAQLGGGGGGGDLQRKKSLAHRIRNMNNRGGRGGPSGRLTSPDGVYGARSPDAVGPATSGSQGDRNPFFNEFGKEPENIAVRRADAQSPTSPPPPVPRRGSDFGAPIERRVTSDATSPGVDEGKPSGGFLSRVKSLKGGRRNRQPSDAAPGTAV